jgi:hypothetical protein
MTKVVYTIKLIDEKTGATATAQTSLLAFPDTVATKADLQIRATKHAEDLAGQHEFIMGEIMAGNLSLPALTCPRCHEDPCICRDCEAA